MQGNSEIREIYSPRNICTVQYIIFIKIVHSCYYFHVVVCGYRLIQDREVDLTDGTRLLRHDRFNKSMKASGLTEQEMKERYREREEEKVEVDHTSVYI